MNPLRELRSQGQSIWLDYIRRTLITGGELKRLVQEDGLRGVTSNPTIFEKAVSGSTDYDEALRTLLHTQPGSDARQLFTALAIEDIQMAADILRPVYDESAGADGFVSLEASPYVAYDREGTITEVRRLWRAVDRPNVMIKVPATPEGIQAVATLTAEGININITLMFSLAHYEAVAQAYIRGLECCADPRRVASVASFFVSRVDTVVDRELERLGTPEALALRGKAAIANARLAYRRFREIFYGAAFSQVKKRGAQVQRPLWASTGTKNPAYRDVLYVEELIGPDTVNTMPPATLGAFRDHGRVRGATIREGAEEAGSLLGRLKRLGVNLAALSEKLQKDGVASFAASFDQLMVALGEKRKALTVGPVDRQTMDLDGYRHAVEERFQTWRRDKFACRLWQKDPTLWFPKKVPEIVDRLGWLALPETMQDEVDELKAFAEEMKSEGMRHAVLLGMGGSSLAPEVFHKTFGNRPGYAELIVLDSTHPGAVRAVENRVNLRQTLFLVSSKSGTTTETLSLFRYFWARTREIAENPGHHFVAITDPGTPLEQTASDRGFRRVFEAPPDVGGRYSALTVFGLVPAALIGAEVETVLDRSRRMVEACSFCVPETANPCLSLGAALGELALAGRDKVTFVATRSLAAFPSWIEQLIAESTGKDGKGIVPVVGEALESPDLYGSDRVFVWLGLKEDDHEGLEEKLAALRAAGHPVIGIHLDDKADLGGEFFRWEVAVAAAGAALRIHPFDQPDVQLAKDLAKKAMEKKRRGAASTDRNGVEETAASEQDSLRRAVASWAGKAKAGDYIAIQAYLSPTLETGEGLQSLRVTLRNRLRVATTLGYGPRFLHSTGQLHKGGPNSALILQIVDEPAEELPVPETDYSFRSLISAQALGDYQALQQRGRRVLRVNLGRDVAAGVQRLVGAVRA